jgi:hypothetical protein
MNVQDSPIQARLNDSLGSPSLSQEAIIGRALARACDSCETEQLQKRLIKQNYNEQG